ncbi:MAG: ABC transporter substrate-binding protein [Ectothiorhodospiraceae bacterium]|nr:ABC transporter substrate-binding protein [Ectothiorhodospiraceae bacterium]
MRSWIRYALAAVLTAVLGAGAHARTPSDTLVMAFNIDDIISLDPAEVFELVGGEVIANIYDRITMHEPENLEALVGGVAESWEVSADGKTITLKVRPGQKFHSGNPVTADDVVFSLTRVVKLEKTPVFLLNQFGWTKDNVDQHVTRVDDMTLRLHIPEDLAPSLVLNVLSAGVASVVDMKTVMQHEKDGDLGYEWLKTNSAGSGPFKLVSWKPNEGVVFEANPGYRHGAPGMKRVVLRHVPEPAAQRLLVEKGDADIARNLSADQVKGLAGNADIRIQTDPKATSVYLQVNMKDPVLSKPKVREALRWLVDYEGMTKSFLEGQFKVHQSFWPSGFFASLTENPYKLDIEKGKALLAEAGVPAGFEVELDAFNSSPYSDIAQSVQDTLGRAGLKVKILQAEKKAVYTKHRGRQHQMILTHWSPDYLDPHSNADAFSSNPDNRDEAKLTGVIAWRGSWETPENTKLTADAKKEVDAAKREQMYLTLQRNVQTDSPFVFMFQSIAQAAVRKNVDGFVSGPSFDLVFYRNVKKQ